MEGDVSRGRIPRTWSGSERVREPVGRSGLGHLELQYLSRRKGTHGEEGTGSLARSGSSDTPTDRRRNRHGSHVVRRTGVVRGRPLSVTLEGPSGGPEFFGERVPVVGTSVDRVLSVQQRLSPWIRTRPLGPFDGPPPPPCELSKHYPQGGRALFRSSQVRLKDPDLSYTRYPFRPCDRSPQPCNSPLVYLPV